MIGVAEYGWKFVGSDIDETAVQSAKAIISSNPSLQGMIEIRHQPNRNKIFQHILQPNESFHFSMCNPPFHTSATEAKQSTDRKWRNLSKNAVLPLVTKAKKIPLNFGGRSKELFCEGGELAFIRKIIQESVEPEVASRVGWFTCLVSKVKVLSHTIFLYQFCWIPITAHF